MLRGVRYSGGIRRTFLRLKSTRSNPPRAKISKQDDSDPIDINSASSLHEKSSLPFAHRKDTGAFGQAANVVADPHLVLQEDLIRMQMQKDVLKEQDKGESESSSSGQRTHPTTLKAMAPRNQVQIPPLISKAIRSHITGLRPIKRLRTAVSDTYVALQTDEVHKPTRSEMECDAHIGAMFIQNYTSIHQVLSELKKRIKDDFNPQKVLDIGFGPATGMIVLNEIMGNDFKPQIKHSLILGHESMKDRAKILLSRQVNEYTGDIKDLQVEIETAKAEADEEAARAAAEERAKSEAILYDTSYRKKLEYAKRLYQQTGDVEDLEIDIEIAERAKAEVDAEVELADIESDSVIQDAIDERLGPIKTKQIRVKTKLIDYISPNQKYDFIIATHQMLQDASRFPYQVDENVDILLQSLEPNGHLIIVERGTPLGFESMARAREVMLRPKRFDNENGKLPRPYRKELNTKGKEKANLGKYSELYDPELAGLEVDDFGQTLNEQKQPEEPYYLSVVAPCPHHDKCPLQTSKPEYFKTPTGRNLAWCHYEKKVERPKYMLEIKRGKVLASQWDSVTAGRAITGTEGSGRIDGKNYEIGSFSYLIVHRTPNDKALLSRIETERALSTREELVGLRGSDESDWPRVILPPMKKKGHITMAVCGPSGKFEKWTVAKSQKEMVEDENGDEERVVQLYHDARKTQAGDLWPFDAKTKTAMPSSIEEKTKRIENYLKNKNKHNANMKKLIAKEEKKKLAVKHREIQLGEDVILEDKLDVFAENFDNRKKQIQEDKKVSRASPKKKF